MIFRFNYVLKIWLYPCLFWLKGRPDDLWFALTLYTMFIIIYIKLYLFIWQVEAILLKLKIIKDKCFLDIFVRVFYIRLIYLRYSLGFFILYNYNENNIYIMTYLLLQIVKLLTNHLVERRICDLLPGIVYKTNYTVPIIRQQFWKWITEYKIIFVYWRWHKQ